jgi:hypothetical protein
MAGSAVNATSISKCAVIQELSHKGQAHPKSTWCYFLNVFLICLVIVKVCLIDTLLNYLAADVVVPIYNPSYSGGSHSKPGWSKKQDLI